MLLQEDSPDAVSGSALVESIATVVAVEGDVVWLEPDALSGCSACASSGACGAKGWGTAASRMEARRFALLNPDALRLGERVVVGVRDSDLLTASVTAYLLPLGIALLAGVIAQTLAGQDVITLLAMLGGLVAGLVVARQRAQRLAARGGLVPQYLRRACSNVNGGC